MPSEQTQLFKSPVLIAVLCGMLLEISACVGSPANHSRRDADVKSDLTADQIATQCKTCMSSGDENEYINKQLRKTRVELSYPVSIPYQATDHVKFTVHMGQRQIAHEAVIEEEHRHLAEEVPLSRMIKVTLTGPSKLVKITTDDKSEQELVGEFPRTWYWHVEPLGVEGFDLVLKVVSVVQSRSGRSDIEIQSFETKTAITVTYIQSIKLMMADISPIGGFVVSLATGIGGILTWLGVAPKLRRKEGRVAFKKKAK